jgi:hypothetical protein
VKHWKATVKTSPAMPRRKLENDTMECRAGKGTLEVMRAWIVTVYNLCTNNWEIVKMNIFVPMSTWDMVPETVSTGQVFVMQNGLSLRAGRWEACKFRIK